MKAETPAQRLLLWSAQRESGLKEGGNDGGRERSQFLKIEASELVDRLDRRCGEKWRSQSFGVHDIYSGEVPAFIHI